jgi:hypothetical protein
LSRLCFSREGRVIYRILLPFARFSALLPCLLLVGCVPLPYVYPSLSYVPSTVVPSTDGRVYAFRVDTVETCNGDSVCAWEFSEKFSPVAVTDGTTVSQAQLSLKAGCYLPGPISLLWHHGENLEVRLYRPGYPVLKFRSWELLAGSDLAWSALPDLASQEKALDELTGREDGPGAGLGRLSPAPGSTSRKHRDCLLFFASEYERLAARVQSDGPDTQAGRDRLLAKARDLKELADK